MVNILGTRWWYRISKGRSTDDIVGEEDEDQRKNLNFARGLPSTFPTAPSPTTTHLMACMSSEMVLKVYQIVSENNVRRRRILCSKRK